MYFQEQVKLLSKLLSNRNYLWKTSLEPQFPIELTFKQIYNENLSTSKSHYEKFLLTHDYHKIKRASSSILWASRWAVYWPRAIQWSAKAFEVRCVQTIVQNRVHLYRKPSVEQIQSTRTLRAHERAINHRAAWPSPENNHRDQN